MIEVHHGLQHTVIDEVYMAQPKYLRASVYQRRTFSTLALTVGPIYQVGGAQ